MSHSSRRDFIRLSSLGLGGLATRKPEIQHGKALPAPEKKQKIVCLGAHPGDPEFGCGGTMARYSADGHEIVFLYLTRGEAFDPRISPADAAKQRTKEAEIACAALGVKPVFAGQTDGATILDPQQNEKLKKLIQAESPDLVFSQWPMDTHPDHQVTGLLALNAWKTTNRSFDLYFYEVNTGSETMSFVPTDYVDITAFRSRKKEAMWAHKTQDPEKTYESFFRQMEEFRGLEAGVTAAEAFIHYKSARSGHPGL